MPWETSNRKAELPTGWDAIRTRVLGRDRYRCQWPREGRRDGICGAAATDVDHKLNRDDHRDEALWSLCGWHHSQKTQQESAEARRAIAAKGLHPVEKHPIWG